MNLKTKYSSIHEVAWDVVIIGAGAAGLMTCLELPSNLNVLLLNRNTSRRSSSRWAQGGIAAVTRNEDSPESHAADTIQAGAGLCDEDAVRLLVKDAPKCVARLQKLGMEFDRDGKTLATTLEAAHSHRRVLHVKDQTGRALVDVLQDQVEQRSNVIHKRGVRVTQLWVEQNCCCGVQILDGKRLHWISARAIVLATGGGGHLFANTTNPAQACGEGIALAWKAGAAIEDLEFVQFHPTALKLDGAPSFLISEALRGEGAVIVDQNGASPVANLKGRDLATRDQVSRALVKAMQHQKVDRLGLSLNAIADNFAEAKFPSILQRCRELGIEPLKEVIPIAPAAHYWMGGVATNLNASTSLPGLYAVGEVACTGLHGANRLASNSLMECLVFAKQLESIELNSSKYGVKNKQIVHTFYDFKRITGDISAKVLMNSIEALRKLCWNEAGVNRCPKGMKGALENINLDIQQLKEHPLLCFLNNQTPEQSHLLDETARQELNLLLDLSHRQITSALLFEACLFRTESRGGHFRTDAPKSQRHWECHSRQIKGNGLSTRPVRS